MNNDSKVVITHTVLEDTTLIYYTDFVISILTRDATSDMRKEYEFFDVSLVSSDYKVIEEHKVILSSKSLVLLKL